MGLLKKENKKHVITLEILSVKSGSEWRIFWEDPQKNPCPKPQNQ